MLSLTLKNIPKKLHAQLKESAKRNRRSLNSEILARLESDFSARVVDREAHARALREFTPCRFADAEDQARALATVHAELILIHPFRDGNGRCARLLATLMGLQAGLPALDFGGIRGETKLRYIGALHAAMDRDYRPMTAIFRGVIARSLRTQVTVSSASGRS